MMRFILVFLLACIASFNGFAQETLGSGELKWMSIEEAEIACRKQPRKIFIDVYTDWCGWCKKMDKSTFRDSLVLKYASEKYYAVKMNAEDRKNVIFRDKLFKFNEGMRSHDLAVLLLNGQMSYPSIVFMDEKLQPIQTHGGYADAAQFNMMLHFFGENAYKKKKSMNDFSRDFRP